MSGKVKIGSRGRVAANGKLTRENIYRDKPVTEAEMLSAQWALWAWVHKIPNPLKAMG